MLNEAGGDTMGQVGSVIEQVGAASEREHASSLFQSLILTSPEKHTGRAGTTLAVSVLFHTLLVLAIAIVPLLFYDALPSQDALKAFFVAPLEVAPPPPPPPPPPSGPRPVAKAAPKIVQQTPQSFVAPIEVPTEIKPEESLDLGLEGVPGGVEGGVPGGVVGGVVGGLPQAPPPPERVVRIGGQIAQPRLIRKVSPVYPDLAVQSRLSGMVILEAEVDTRGFVRTVKVLRGHPLFDEPAMDAVKKWRYQPLLLNGQPTAFILTVTVSFALQPAK
jgi:periplasmic protein TonB